MNGLVSSLHPPTLPDLITFGLVEECLTTSTYPNPPKEAPTIESEFCFRNNGKRLARLFMLYSSMTPIAPNNGPGCPREPPTVGSQRPRVR